MPRRLDLPCIKRKEKYKVNFSLARDSTKSYNGKCYPNVSPMAVLEMCSRRTEEKEASFLLEDHQFEGDFRRKVASKRCLKE